MKSTIKEERKSNCNLSNGLNDLYPLNSFSNYSFSNLLAETVDSLIFCPSDVNKIKEEYTESDPEEYILENNNFKYNSLKLFKIENFIDGDTKMKNRRKTKLAIKQYKCQWLGCKKEYKSKENLTLHTKNIHFKIKPYKCRFCIMEFSHRNGKTYHERKYHINKLPYKCLSNGKDF